MTVCVGEATMVLRLTWGDGEGESLDVADDCVEAAGMWLAGPLTLPAFETRDEEAPPSGWVPGDIVLSQVLDSDRLTGTLAVKGTTLASVQAQKALWAAAVFHRHLTVSVLASLDAEEDVVIGSWAGRASYPAWGDTNGDRLAMLTASTPINIRVNPPGSP